MAALGRRRTRAGALAPGAHGAAATPRVAYLAGGDPDSCLMELQAASAAFDRLGARLEVASSKRRIAEVTALRVELGDPGRAS